MVPTRFIFATLLTLSGVFLLPSVTFADTALDSTSLNGATGALTSSQALGAVLHPFTDTYVTDWYLYLNSATSGTSTINVGVNVWDITETGTTSLTNIIEEGTLITFKQFSTVFSAGSDYNAYRFHLPVLLRGDRIYALVINSVDQDNTTTADPDLHFYWHATSTTRIMNYPPFEYGAFYIGSNDDLYSDGEIISHWKFIPKMYTVYGDPSNNLQLDVLDTASTTAYCQVNSDGTAKDICNIDTIGSADGSFLIRTTAVSDELPMRWYVQVIDQYDDYANNYNQAGYSQGYYSEYSPTNSEFYFKPTSWTSAGNSYKIIACLGNEDYYMGVNDAEQIDCVEVFFGHGLDATTTNQLAVEAGAAIDTSGAIPPNEDSCGTVFTDGWFTCTLLAFTEDILSTFPFGYFTTPMLGYYEYTNTTATTAAQFVVGFNVSDYFDSATAYDPDIPEITTTWNLTNAANHARTLNPDLFTTIDDFMWLLVYVYIAYRVFNGAWYQGSSGAVNWYTRGKDADRRRELSQAHYDMRRAQTAYYKYNVMKKK